jgi:hypothetical protein
MTIAAGFPYQGGVLLCADTEQSSWAMTFNASKLAWFDYPGGKVGFAFSGNSVFAGSAVHKCKERLQTVPPERAFAELEKTLEKEYRRHVLGHPDHATDLSLRYELLIAIWSELAGKTELYSAAQTAVLPVPSYECIGAGDVLAHYLIRPNFGSLMPENYVLSLAAYMLVNVKGYALGCGGPSQFLLIRDDGSLELGDAATFRIDHLERYCKGYDLISRNLLFAMSDLGLSEESFRQQAEIFKDHVLNMRKAWRPRQAAQPNLQSTTTDPSLPQPSPDSPEGSGES